MHILTSNVFSRGHLMPNLNSIVFVAECLKPILIYVAADRTQVCINWVPIHRFGALVGAQLFCGALHVSVRCCVVLVSSFFSHSDGDALNQ